MTDEIYDALDAARHIFEDIDPSPQSSLTGVWVFPEEESSIDLSILPAMIVSQAINQLAGFIRGTHRDSIDHQWSIEGLLFLNEGPITQEDARGAEAEETQRYWLPAIARAFYSVENQRLLETITRMGQPGSWLINYQVGQVVWQTQVYFGVRIIIPVLQTIGV